MDDELYDEFGNYIGPEIVESDDDGSEESEEDPEGNEEDMDQAGDGLTTLDEVEVSQATDIVLHEDKKYYPDAEDVYEGAEVRVEEEDSQPLTEPIIAPVKKMDFDHLETSMPATTYNREFTCGLMENPALVRNIAIVGHLHHGKTSFLDQLVKQTHPQITSNGSKGWDLGQETRYTDTRKDEQERGLSIKSTPMTMVLPGEALLCPFAPLPYLSPPARPRAARMWPLCFLFLGFTGRCKLQTPARNRGSSM